MLRVLLRVVVEPEVGTTSVFFCCFVCFLVAGHSDGTLNPSGVRFGSSEIYNVGKLYRSRQPCLCVFSACVGFEVMKTVSFLIRPILRSF